MLVKKNRINKENKSQPPDWLFPRPLSGQETLFLRMALGLALGLKATVEVMYIIGFTIFYSLNENNCPRTCKIIIVMLKPKYKAYIPPQHEPLPR